MNLVARLVAVSALVSCSLSLGCVAVASPVGQGMLFTTVTGPVGATSNATPADERTGTSKAYNILGLVALGDAGIDAAKKSGGISRITSVDHESFTALGLFSSFTTIVRGEPEQPLKVK